MVPQWLHSSSLHSGVNPVFSLALARLTSPADHLLGGVFSTLLLGGSSLFTEKFYLLRVGEVVGFFWIGLSMISRPTFSIPQGMLVFGEDSADWVILGGEISGEISGCLGLTLGWWHSGHRGPFIVCSGGG